MSDPKKRTVIGSFFFCVLEKKYYLCDMKLTKKEQLFMELLEKEGVVWQFDYVMFNTKDKKGFDKVIAYKAWNIAYDLLEKGLIKVNPKNNFGWVKA